MQRRIFGLVCSIMPFFLIADMPTGHQEQAVQAQTSTETAITPQSTNSESNRVQTTIFSGLSEAEKSAMGIDKLTQNQLILLDDWIKHNKSYKNKYANKPKHPTLDASITESKENGRFLTLSNGMQIEITGSGRKKSPTWKADDLVRLEQAYKKGWIKITQVSTGQKARAKILSGEFKDVPQSSSTTPEKQTTSNEPIASPQDIK